MFGDEMGVKGLAVLMFFVCAGTFGLGMIFWEHVLPLLRGVVGR